MKQSINHWYFVIALLCISALLWFFIDANQVHEQPNMITTAKVAAKSIPGSFNKNSLDNLKRRFVIPRIDLADLPPYTSSTVPEKPVTKKNESVNAGVQTTPIPASSSNAIQEEFIVQPMTQPEED